MQGRAKVVWDDGDGELVETELQPGLGYSCAIGQSHRLVGITDCDVLEVSTPEIGTTFRLEDDYARPDETEAVREAPDRGWHADPSPIPPTRVGRFGEIARSSDPRDRVRPTGRVAPTPVDAVADPRGPCVE